jgi:hypothetical protein
MRASTLYGVKGGDGLGKWKHCYHGAIRNTVGK